MKKYKRTSFLSFSQPTLDDDDINEVVDSLKSGWITTGPKSLRFEEMFADYIGVENAVATNSATAGLNLVLRGIDLKPGDKVITPSMTWVSTVNMIELLGAEPVFVDIDPDTLQLMPSEVRKKIDPNTKAVIPVHYGGQPCDLDALKNIIKGKDIALIEDAAHAIGSCYKNSLIGSDSQFAIFSFHPNKNITTGEGGMVVSRNKEILERIRHLKFHGITKDAWKRFSKGGNFNYEVIEPGYKYNMLDIQASLGLRQLKKLDEFNERRRFLAERYNDLLTDIKEITPLVSVDYLHKHVWHLYVVKLDIDLLKVTRDEFMQCLQEKNIGTGLHYTPVHLHKYYREKYGYQLEYLPNTDFVSKRIFSLPLYPLMSKKDQDDVYYAIKTVIKECYE